MATPAPPLSIELDKAARELRTEYPGDLYLSEEIAELLEKASEALALRHMPDKLHPPLVPEGFTLVNQTDNSTCVHACLAMITGEKIENIIEIFDDPSDNDGLTTRQVYRYLTSRGILPVPQDNGLISSFHWRGVYKVAVPSLNRPGRVHSVIVTYDKNGKRTVYDPQYGREGVKAYPPNAMDHDSDVYFHPMEVLLLMDMS